MNNDFIIDPEFDNVIPKMMPDEFKLLEEQIVSIGEIINPIIIWNNTIIDGHNRYRILMKHPKLKYQTYIMIFKSRDEAILWICKNQLGRRNLSEINKRYLIGKQYETEKRIEKFYGNQYTLTFKSGLGQNDPDQNYHGTRTRIAKENNVSESYVKRANQFQKGLDAAESVLPGIKEDVLSGKLNPTLEDVASLYKLNDDERLKTIEAMKHKQTEKNSYFKGPIEDSLIKTLSEAVSTFIDTFNNFFSRFPQLRTESPYKEKSLEILNAAKKYITNIEGEIING